MTLSWRVQNFVVVGWVHFKLEHCKFWSIFEFDRNIVSGTGPRSPCLSNTSKAVTTHFRQCKMRDKTLPCEIPDLPYIIYKQQYSDWNPGKCISVHAVQFWEFQETKWPEFHFEEYINGWVQKRHSFSALAMELWLSCTNQSVFLFWLKSTSVHSKDSNWYSDVSQHIEANTIWLTHCRWHFQIHFLVFLYLYLNFTEICSK